MLGMIVLLGKHQFTVSSIDDSGVANSESSISKVAASKASDSHPNAKFALLYDSSLSIYSTLLMIS